MADEFPFRKDPTDKLTLEWVSRQFDKLSNALYSLATDGLYSLATYERHVQIPAVASGTPANQAQETTVGTAGGLEFIDTADKYAYMQWEIPDDWIGTDDIYIEIDWVPDAAMSGTDTVEWICTWRSRAETEVIDSGTAATQTVTETDDLAAKTIKHSRITLAYNHADQPLTAQDHIFLEIYRNTSVANNATAHAIVTEFEVIYNSNNVPTSN